jgi:hypothetical protein
LAPTIDQRIRAIDLEIEGLLYGTRGGPFGLAMGDDEKRVLRLVRYRRGAKNAITIAEMRNAMIREGSAHPEAGGYTILGDREIKQAVRTLRLNYHLPIGSNKAGMGGYFIMISDEDHAILASQILDQVRGEIEVLRAVSSPRAALELLGQLQLELGREAQG